jgi:hypothetical protein
MKLAAGALTLRFRITNDSDKDSRILKRCIVIMRQACHMRLRGAVYHWARVAIQHDELSRHRYAELRKRGHNHGRALRSVADRLLAVTCAMLTCRAAFDPEYSAKRMAA